MDAYIYQADIYCEDCGEKLCREFDKPDGMDSDNESSWDSDDYPKGPYPDGGGEADCPQHCGGCGTFLENPLTGDGREYLLDAISEAIAGGGGDIAVLEEWAEYYDVRLSELLSYHHKRMGIR